ncbi:hypothetical protein [Rhizobium sp. R693]|uniref:hypothetical protein n=1 Tax=Rhizobium sp. R693 TaxID=1764276 RepID=UPI000B52F512|nr:hypothetical protein [Rhizobium sp. R693]OWV90401.1 hypothetical protein ATY79_28590 [Rhizobium sp. R693]
MAIVESPKEKLPLYDYIGNPIAIFDGSDGLLCYSNAGPTRGQITVVRFAEVISLKVLPVNSEYLSQYKYPLKHFAFNEIFGADETKPWEDVEARLWAMSFNDLVVEVMFMGAVTVDNAETANRTVDALVRAVR